MSELYTRPNLPVTKVPRLDVDFRSVVGREQPDRQDQKIAKVQASVLATSAPLVKFWSHLSQQGITAKSDVAIPAGDVVKVIKDTLVLIGNASNYITCTRRMNFIDSINGAHQKLAIFLRKVTREDVKGTDGDLFGPQVRKKLPSRHLTRPLKRWNMHPAGDVVPLQGPAHVTDSSSGSGTSLLQGPTEAEEQGTDTRTGGL